MASRIGRRADPVVVVVIAVSLAGTTSGLAAALIEARRDDASPPGRVVDCPLERQRALDLFRAAPNAVLAAPLHPTDPAEVQCDINEFVFYLDMTKGSSG